MKVIPRSRRFLVWLLLSLLVAMLVTMLAAIVADHGWVDAKTLLRKPSLRRLDPALFEQAQRDATTFAMPGEFEPIESMWMAYPVYENVHGRPSQTVQADMIKALVPHTSIDLLVQDPSEQTQVQQWLAGMNLPSDRVRLHIVPHTDIWMRDMGPIFLQNAAGKQKIADFGFSTWSYNEPTHADAMTDEAVDRLIARDLKLPILRSSLISEGGNREFNGKGTLIVTEAVELQRNLGMSKADIEAELKRVFRLKKVIWLKQGLADDDLSTKGQLPGGIFTVLTTGGHIDEFARFVNPTTILLAQVTPQERDEDPISRITYDRMEENYRILRAATDQDGKPFTIIRVPIAAPLYQAMDERDQVFRLLQGLTFEDGSVIPAGRTINTILAASYLNFVVANDVVLLPAYWQPGRSETIRQKDAAVKRIFQQVFPDRRIVPINPENINVGGGGMHCIVQQMPALPTQP